MLSKSAAEALRSSYRLGGIAQLGERLNGIQEVSGSIPLISTKKHPISKEIGCFLYWLNIRLSPTFFTLPDEFNAWFAKKQSMRPGTAGYAWMCCRGDK